MSAYGVIMVVNWIIFVFGMLMVFFGIYALTTFGDDAFFSRQTYALMIVCGLLTFGMIYLACVGARDPENKPNYLFCYWCLVSILLIGNFIGFYYLRVFKDGLDRTNEVDEGDGVLNVLENQVAKEAQDFMLSVYTTCCTGCVGVEGCEDFNSTEITGEVFCVESFLAANVAEGVEIEDDECIFAEICSADVLVALNASDGLGLGCYTTLDEIPGFNVGVDTCTVFQELDINGRNLVGPAESGSCGGGDPAKFVKDVVRYFDNNFFLIAFSWGTLIAFLSIAWLAAVFMILFHSSGKDLNKQR